MKKITALLFAGIIAMAFASVSDAATAVRTAAPKVQNQINVTNVTNNVYTNSTSNVNLGQTKNFGYTSWYSQSHGTNTNEYKMNQYMSQMVNAGWSASSSTSKSGNYTYRTDTFTKTENIVTVSTKVDTVDKISYAPMSYHMEDGVLVASKGSVIDRTVTTTVTTNTDTRTTTQTAYGYGEPITLDTTNTGKITTARNEWLLHPAFYSEFASKFDFTGDGIPENCEWLSDNPDALLCMPVKGQINGVTELFGNLGGYANGFDKLSVLCDKDGNGIVEGNELEGLMLWVDSNRNGVADAGELKTLDSYGITKFYTDHKDFVGKYETSDGQTHTMWAWFPSLQQ